MSESARISKATILKFAKDKCYGYSNGSLSKFAITGKTKLSSELQLDSLDLVELAMDLEMEYTVDLGDAHDLHWKTIADVVDAVWTKLPVERRG